jgi:hypothetical protein
MPKTNLVPFVLEHYKNGQRYFEDLDLENESFEGEDLEGIIFDRCLLYVSFRGANLKNAQFLNGGIKTCDFQEADLTNARFENLNVESSQFAGSTTTNIYFDNNWAYGQAVTQDDFNDWIKDYPENQYQDELNRLKTILLQLDKYLEGSNYEPHFEINLLCESTHFDQVIPEMNKRIRKQLVTESAFREISYPVFKADILEKIRYTGKPGPDQSTFATDAVRLIESQLFQLIEQKFPPNVTRFYLAPNNNQWIFWNFSFLIISRERNKTYLLEGGASD